MKKLHIKDLIDIEVYILLEHKFRKQLFENLFNKFKNKKDAALAIGAREGYSLTRYQKGIRFCPLSIIRKIYSILGYSLNNIEKYILEIKQGSNGKTGLANSIKCPKLPYIESKELAYLIGKFIGDGSITINKDNALQISYYNNDDILRKEFKIYSYKYFGEVCIKEKNKNIYLPSIAGYILLQFCKNFKTFDSKVPIFIQENIEYMRYFLRAIFEDEGCVYHKGDCRLITLGMSNKDIILQINKMLQKFNINSNPIKETKNKHYRIDITGRENLLKFSKEIGFAKKYYKNKKLEQALNTYKFYQSRQGESRRRILEYLQNNKNHCSTIELCKILNFKRKNILKHLNRLEKENKIIRNTKKPLQDSKGRLLGNLSHEWVSK